jgi:hypothetical protein
MFSNWRRSPRYVSHSWPDKRVLTCRGPNWALFFSLGCIWTPHQGPCTSYYVHRQAKKNRGQVFDCQVGPPLPHSAGHKSGSPPLSTRTRHTARSQWRRGYRRAQFRFRWPPWRRRLIFFFRASPPKLQRADSCSRIGSVVMATQALLSGRQLLGRPVQSAVAGSSSSRKAPFVVRASSSPPAKVRARSSARR